MDSHWGFVLQRDRGAAMALHELETLATDQYRDASRHYSHALIGAELGSPELRGAYHRRIAEVARDRAALGVASARAAAANIETWRMVADSAVIDVPPSAGVLRIEEANRGLLELLVKTEEWLASLLAEAVSHDA